MLQLRLRLNQQLTCGDAVFNTAPKPFGCRFMEGPDASCQIGERIRAGFGQVIHDFLPFLGLG